MSDAVAPEPTGEATPSTNTNPAPEVAPAEPAAPAPVDLGLSPEEAEQFKTFLSNNGGFSKAFAKLKNDITGRQQDQPVSQSPTPNPLNDSITQGAQVTVQMPVPEPPKGTLDPNDFLVQQYFESLATKEEYANIANDIRSGAVLKEMTKFNIAPTVNGRLNDTQIRDFLGLYAKTQPAVAPAAPVTTTPTVEYVQVGDQISTMEQAMQVLQQDQQLRAQGREGHPMAKQANEFFDGVLNANQKRGQREHTVIDPAAKK